MVNFTHAKREILNNTDMKKWTNSKAYDDFMMFINALNDSTARKSVNDCAKPFSDVINRLIKLLDQLDALVDQIPPSDQPQRFGNKAYRVWHEKLIEDSDILIQQVLNDSALNDSIVELKSYLQDSFGNATRIDYGTGHEACFLIFLLCLYSLKIIVDDNFLQLICIVFERYLALCRKLQLVYRMEPAGSHGVWCLDDYQFLPFIFGSAQLIEDKRFFPDNPNLTPDCYVKDGFAEKYADQFMFMGCIKFINQVKTGLFCEHSNQLWNISCVKEWRKVNQGLIKMYQNEVKNKIFSLIFNGNIHRK
uniref:Serine/threonine-protein phosphatase 2A activator n=1 Tax=Romanomermis culicivorax TaxID=13658 RepID=A0A915IFG5_ROMCU